jgi:hypothetical protein
LRLKGPGFDGVTIGGITPATDGGLWVGGTEGGLSGRPFLRKVGGEGSACGSDGQRFLSEIASRFDRRQGIQSLTTVQDGRFYVGFTGPGSVFVARINEATCAVDTSFGDLGVARVPVIGFTTVTGITLERDRRDGVLVAVSAPAQLLLRRLTPVGLWDSAFGTSGLATHPNSDGFWLGGLAVTTSGDILVSGSVSIPFGFQPALLKLDAMGRPVTSFGTSGVQRYPELSIGTAGALQAVLEPNRVVFSATTARSVVVGDFNTHDSVIAAADLQTGRLVSSFGTSGYLRWDWGYANSNLIGPILPNGRGGYTACGHVIRSLLAGQPAALVDVNGSGQPDPGLPNQGRRLIAETNSANCIGMARMADGRLAVAANDAKEAVVMLFNK